MPCRLAAYSRTCIAWGCILGARRCSLRHMGLQPRTSMPPMDEKVLPRPMSSARMQPRTSLPAAKACADNLYGKTPTGHPAGTPAQKRTDAGWCFIMLHVQPSRHSSHCRGWSASSSFCRCSCVPCGCRLGMQGCSLGHLGLQHPVEVLTSSDLQQVHLGCCRCSARPPTSSRLARLSCGGSAAAAAAAEMRLAASGAAGLGGFEIEAEVEIVAEVEVEVDVAVAAAVAALVASLGVALGAGLGAVVSWVASVSIRSSSPNSPRHTAHLLGRWGGREVGGGRQLRAGVRVGVEKGGRAGGGRRVRLGAWGWGRGCTRRCGAHAVCTRCVHTVCTCSVHMQRACSVHADLQSPSGTASSTGTEQCRCHARGQSSQRSSSPAPPHTAHASASQSGQSQPSMPASGGGSRHLVRVTVRAKG